MVNKQHADAASLITNLDKVYWPEEGYTKGDLLEYYRKMAPFILPFLKDRPQTLHRFPNGIQSEGFYQKNIDGNAPEWVPTCVVKHREGENRYLLISNLESLLFAVNLGCIDLNPFNSRIQYLDYPDYLIIDLDPRGIAFKAVIETAQVYHELLESNDIPSFCKTSGATGLHIYIPLEAKYTYEQTKQFAELLAHIVHAKLPRITSIERNPSKRKKKVYLDYLQNNFGQTMAAAYSVRPRLKAPVSMPLKWSEVKSGLDPSEFHIKNAFKYVSKRGNIFLPILGKGIDLLSCLNRLRPKLLDL